MPRDKIAQRRAKQRYKKSPKGRAAEARYKKSAAGKAASARYFAGLNRKTYERRLALQRKWRQAHPDNVRAYNRRAKIKAAYGLTEEQWNAIFAAQNYSCAGCGSDVPKSKRGWVTDHQHGTVQVRGILCLQCNVALGMVGDDPNTLRRLANYLEIGESYNARH